MAEQRICGRSMAPGIKSQCNSRIEIWRQRFASLHIDFINICNTNNNCHACTQFVQEPFEQVHYFSVGLLCLLLLFYLTQTIVLPVRRITVHFCFIVCISIVILAAYISLSDKLQFRGLASPTLLHLHKQIKTRRFIRYCFFLLLWFLALFCSYIGLVILRKKLFYYV